MFARFSPLPTNGKQGGRGGIRELTAKELARAVPAR